MKLGRTYTDPILVGCGLSVNNRGEWAWDECRRAVWTNVWHPTQRATPNMCVMVTRRSFPLPGDIPNSPCYVAAVLMSASTAGGGSGSTIPLEVVPVPFRRLLRRLVHAAG